MQCIQANIRETHELILTRCFEICMLLARLKCDPYIRTPHLVLVQHNQIRTTCPLFFATVGN